MKITHRNIAGPLADDLRGRADYALHASREWWSATQCIRYFAREGFRALALLRAADRIDAKVGTVSDGLHYADGQLFNIHEGRPEAV